jgi:hypothetical protein
MPIFRENIPLIRIQTFQRKKAMSFFKEYTVKKKYAAVWNLTLYIGEYSGINSLKLKKSGI